uniref:Uncharacterized protein n=1 Tax=Setaria viridis TaxID=4556 RepID=A0A4U6U2D1_SETVI|nr:hypothetical protein SEVIR_6G120050v2 [Setaria viridis]
MVGISILLLASLLLELSRRFLAIYPRGYNLFDGKQEPKISNQSLQSEGD